MPPSARENQIASGRYAGITPREWRTVRAKLEVNATAMGAAQ
jgi:hypothetical protein